jgi:hypothetical protein
MNYTLTRMAVMLSALYWAGGLAFAVGSAAFGPQSGFLVFDLYELAGIIVIAYSIPLTALLWISWAIIRLSHRSCSVAAFAVYGIALPFLYLGALQVPGQIERGWHAHQLALARVESITDEPLLTEQGNLIGVRLTYRVSFPWGLSSLNQEPPADAPSADLNLPFAHSPLLDFATRGSTLPQVSLGGFRPGSTEIAVDFVPPFLPLSFQMPKAFPASDLSNRCFRWKSAETRQEWLDAGAERLKIAIGPYGRYLPPGSRRTEHAYRLSDFYLGAKAEGAVECP